jgi:hypothetical protein
MSGSEADLDDESGLGGPGTTSEHTNYVGAVYGSLLAASVVAGTSPLDGAPTLLELVVLLLVTGLVFWAAHVYARVVGERVATGQAVTRAEVVRVARHEWPLVEAAIGPCLVATGVAVVGGSAVAVAWAALLTAIVGQVWWGVSAFVKAGAPRRIVAFSAVINLALGLVLVVLKASLTH